MKTINSGCTPTPDKSHHITTGEAAELCSVQPDTVLKWIKEGGVCGLPRLPEDTTASCTATCRPSYRQTALERRRCGPTRASPTPCAVGSSSAIRVFCGKPARSVSSTGFARPCALACWGWEKRSGTPGCSARTPARIAPTTGG